MPNSLQKKAYAHINKLSQERLKLFLNHEKDPKMFFIVYSKLAIIALERLVSENIVSVLVSMFDLIVVSRFMLV
jgi:vacuolar-type H+-ATPase subunit B/Vma2